MEGVSNHDDEFSGYVKARDFLTTLVTINFLVKTVYHAVSYQLSISHFPGLCGMYTLSLERYPYTNLLNITERSCNCSHQQ